MEIDRLYEKFKECSGVTTDSRAIKGGEMFFALKGENFDGNEYALKALSDGARYAVVDGAWLAANPVAGRGETSGRLVPVGNTLDTLQQLARCHREHSFVDGRRLTVIGLTGTNGKTTTKELITKVLSTKYQVTATQGNLNNDIGVPLSVLRIHAGTQLAVIEMGANHPDDIGKLVKVCAPDYGLITNVGRAHLLGFGSFEGVKKAKGQLYDWITEHGGTIFLNADDPQLVAMAAERGCKDVIEYGIGHSGSIVLPANSGHPFVRMAILSQTEEGNETLLGLETHLAGAYNADNIMAAIAVGRHFGVSLEDAIEAIGAYIPSNNRSQMERTGRNVLIKDLYNANPTSMAAALDNLEMTEAGHKVVLLGEMRELGTESLSEHARVVRRILSMDLDLACLVGEEFQKAIEIAGNSLKIKWFSSSEELDTWLGENPVRGATILIKGSRGIQMEKVLGAL